MPSSLVTSRVIATPSFPVRYVRFLTLYADESVRKEYFYGGRAMAFRAFDLDPSQPEQAHGRRHVNEQVHVTAGLVLTAAARGARSTDSLAEATARLRRPAMKAAGKLWVIMWVSFVVMSRRPA